MNEKLANELYNSVQRYLYSNYAKDMKNCRKKEFYHALCNAINEKIGKIWTNLNKKNMNKNLYLLSFEYMPGKFLTNYVTKLNLLDEVKEVVSKAGMKFEDMIEIEKEPALGFGQLGVGSSFLMESLTNNKINTIAYALRYQKGNIDQRIENDRQVEYPNNWLQDGLDWEHEKGFYYFHYINGRQIKAKAYDLPIVGNNNYVNMMRMWGAIPITNVDYSSFSSGDFLKAYKDYINDLSITEFLYVDDSSYEGKKLRLSQEYFYAASSIQDIFRRYFNKEKDLNNFFDINKIIVNDIHPAIALIEFIRILTTGYKMSYRQAIKRTREIFYHIAFSISSDSYETYSMDILKEINKDIAKVAYNINEELKKENRYIIKDDFLIMRNLNLYLSKDYFFLSKIAKESKENKIDIKLDYTNMGIDIGRYFKESNPRMFNYIKSKKIDPYNYDSLKEVTKYKDDSNFIFDIDKIKLENKKSIIKTLNLEDINPYSIYDMQFGVIHENRRQLLRALEIASNYYALKTNVNFAVPNVTYFFAGKASNGYYMAKEIIRFILNLKNLIDKDVLIKDKIKIVFIENYNVTKSQILIKACDIMNDLTLPVYNSEDFEILNACYNMSNIVSSKGGIIYNNTTKNSIYTFGKRLDSIKKIQSENSYNSVDYYYKDAIVKETIDNLINERNQNFCYNFKDIYDQIIKYNDSFMVFSDLRDLYKVKIEAYKDYLNTKKWISQEIDNLIWANEFNFEKNNERYLELGKDDRN